MPGFERKISLMLTATPKQVPPLNLYNVYFEALVKSRATKPSKLQKTFMEVYYKYFQREVNNEEYLIFSKDSGSCVGCFRKTHFKMYPLRDSNGKRSCESRYSMLFVTCSKYLLENWTDHDSRLYRERGLTHFRIREAFMHFETDWMENGQSTKASCLMHCAHNYFRLMKNVSKANDNYMLHCRF